MINRLRKSLLWLIALSFVNSSVDVSEFGLSFIYPDQSFQNGSQDSYNEIESIVEWIITQSGDDGRSLPDTNHDPQKLVKKAGGIDFSMPVRKSQWFTDWQLAQIRKPVVLNNSPHLPDGFGTLFSPPPDFC